MRFWIRGASGRVLGRRRINALWQRAPFVLRYHASILVAVLAAALLVGLTASSAPFLATAAGSAALKARLNELDPLTTGLEIQRDGERCRARPPSRWRGAMTAGVAAIAQRIGYLGTPVKTLELADSSAADARGNGFAEIHVISRTGWWDHVSILSSVPGPWIYLADTTARALHVRPGDTIRLPTQSFTAATRSLPFRVAGVYRALAYLPEEPYWANLSERSTRTARTRPSRPRLRSRAEASSSASIGGSARMVSPRRRRFRSTRAISRCRWPARSTGVSRR